METFFYEYPNPVDNRSAGIEIRKEHEMSEDELFLLKQAGLDSYAPLEAWTALGTNAQISYSTHGIFRYFGKFPSTIAAHFIMQYTDEYDMVMDPMAGSGTTVLEAMLANRNCRSYDVNPLAVLLQRVKTTHIDEDKLLAELHRICDNYAPLSVEQFDWQPVGIRDVDHWFLKETQDSIRGLVYLINQIEDENIKDFYSICLASSIRPVSRATTQQGRLFLDVVTAKEDCLDTFVKKAQKAIKAVSSLPESKSTIDIAEHDASAPFSFGPTNKLIIVHPPYFNSYKYSSVNSLELSWMRINHAEVRKSEVREFFKVGKAENIIHYVEDMRSTLNNIVATLSPDGVMGLMIGDTIIKGEYIQATKMLLEKFLSDNPSITVEKVVLRVPKYTEASWTASQRRTSDKVGVSLNDFIIVFRRNG
ncbi:MAG: DNA methylase [Firmicutes bacterium ADurb.Bin193]|nr:MAG: DNA methylase [Firmicutes bacterium ADurb.Bin193]